MIQKGRVRLVNAPSITHCGLAFALIMEQVRVAAKALGIEAVVIDFVNGPDFATQFDRVVAAAPQAVYVPNSTYFPANRDLLSDLQIKYKLPLIWPSATTAPRAMVGYGATAVIEIRKTGACIDAILKGANPGDLPIPAPSNWELAINLSTAKAIGITIPPSILAQATLVIPEGAQ